VADLANALSHGRKISGMGPASRDQVPLHAGSTHPLTDEAGTLMIAPDAGNIKILRCPLPDGGLLRN
jgi:hypothetical protein